MPAAQGVALCPAEPNGTEDFEGSDYDIGFVPPTNCLYTNGSNLSGVISSDPAGGSNQVWYNDAQGFTVSSLRFKKQACDANDNNIVYTFRFYLNSMPASGNHYLIGLIQGVNPPAATININAFSIQPDGTPGIFSKTGGGSQQEQNLNFAPAGLITANNWYEVSLVIGPGSGTGTAICDGDGISQPSSFTVLFMAGGITYTKSQNLQGTGGGSVGDEAPTQLTGINFADVAQTPSAINVWLDDIEVSGYDISGDGVGSIFCADTDLGSSENWGYDYKEDVVYDTSPPATFALNEAFILSGTTSNSAYLGKAFEPGSKAMATKALVEAAVESTDTQSVFRLAYTTGAATLAAGSIADGGGDMTSAGNGQNTGNFANNIQAVFTESMVGNYWIVAIYYSAGGSTLAQIGASVNYGIAESPTFFNFTVNTSGTTRQGTATGTAVVRDLDGNVIINRTVPVGLSTATWKDQWFVAKGDEAILAMTALDSNDDSTYQSTCIYDLVGTAECVGSCGTEPVQPPITTSTTSGTGGLGTGGSFLESVVSLDLFIGFLLVFGIVWMGVRQGAGGAAIGALFFVALFIGYALGWIPLWIILVLFVISLAAMWFLPRQSSGGF